MDDTRGLETATLQPLFAEYTGCIAEDDPERAYRLAREYARGNGSLLLVCGSLYLAGYVRGKLQPAR